jgi:hypothetical protein
MAGRGRPANPVGSSLTAPFASSSPDRTEQWRARVAALVDVLLKAAEGRAAHCLARHYWPFYWHGEHARPPLFRDDQRKALCEAPKEAVERWLRTHGRQLQWRLDLASGYSMLDPSSYRTASEFRDEMRAYAEAHTGIAKHLRAFQAAPSDKNLRAHAKKALDRLYKSEGREADSLVEDGLHHIAFMAEDCERVACDVVDYLDQRPAQGRSGKNLAAIEVAYLVAAYFDEARVAAGAINDRETALDLKVELSRKPVKETRRGVVDDVINNVPNNSYCHAVEAALGGLGVSQQEVGENGWRSAVEHVCSKRKLRGTNVSDG